MLAKTFAILPLAVLICANYTIAQDILFLKDGSENKIVIEKITDKQIEFRNYGTTDFSSYYVDVDDVLKIKFENGKEKNFNKPTSSLIKPLAEENNLNLGNDVRLRYKRGFSLIDKSGLTINPKMGKHEIQELLAGNPNALTAYKKHKTNAILGKTFLWTGIGLGAASIGFIVAGVADGLYENRIYIGTGLAFGMNIFGITSIPFLILSKINANKVVSLHNKFQRQQNDRYSLNLGATRNGIGVILKF